MRILTLLAAAVAPATIFAQAPAAAPPRNLMSNGGFERVVARNNLWDGVDGDGFLAGERASLPALTESGAVTEMAMPVSVTAGDLNGDGVIDLMTADVEGFFRVYFNRGSATEPKFDYAEMVPIFLSRTGQWRGEERNARRGPRINLIDWDKSGTLDLLIGTYSGEVMLLLNSGSPTAPVFSQPRDINQIIVPTARNDVLWGNLFAPLGTDWDGDGQVDLLLGEGSYSANAIRFLKNSGTTTPPKFTEEDRSYLAYGDGREQLVPALADVNGDGKMDLLVSDRRGVIGAYLTPAGGWKPGTELPFSTDITFGSTTALGGMTTVATADMNGDRLFDIILGRSTGRLALALNKGTKEQPKFDMPVDVKGTDIIPRDSVPSGWNIDTGLERGNMFAQVTAVTAEQDPAAAPVEGKMALRMSYTASTNKVFPRKPMMLASSGKEPTEFHFTHNAAVASFNAPTNTFVLRKPEVPLKNNATYTLSFKYKGKNLRDARWTLAFRGVFERGPAKMERGDRGSVKVTKNEAIEEGKETGTLTQNNGWTTVTKAIKIRFKNRDLHQLKTVPAILELRLSLTPDGVAYFDDVQLVENPA